MLNFVDFLPKATTIKKEMHTNAENFVKKFSNESPPRSKFVSKIPNFESFGPYSHISAPMNVKFSTKE